MFVLGLLLGGIVVWSSLTTGGYSRASAFSYGNLWVSYSWHDRGILPEEVDWLIASAEFPKLQEFDGIEREFRYRYADGTEIRFRPRGDALIWIDEGKNVIEVVRPLSKSLFDRIEESRESASAKTFSEPHDLLKALDVADLPNKSE